MQGGFTLHLLERQTMRDCQRHRVLEAFTSDSTGDNCFSDGRSYKGPQNVLVSVFTNTIHT